MDRLTSMHVFRHVVECGSFSAAAKRLGMSNAAVTKHIQQLESHLRVALLNRTTRRLALTDTGENYFTKCTDILDEVEATELAVKDVNNANTGALRVNAPLDLLMGRSRDLLVRFQTAFPNVSLDLHLSDELVDPVKGGYDMTLRIAKLEPNSSLTHEVVGATDLVLVAAPDFLKSCHPITRPQDLASLPKLSYSHTNRSELWNLTSAANGEVTSIRADGPLRANNGHILMEAATAGLGLAMLPTFIVQRALDDGSLVTVGESFKPRQLEIYALYASNRHVSEKIRNFINFIKDEFKTGETSWRAA